MDTDKLKKQAFQQLLNAAGAAAGLSPKQAKLALTVAKWVAVFLIGFMLIFLIILTGPAGKNASEEQPYQQTSTLFIKSNGTCLPTGAGTYIAFFNAAAKWASGNYPGVTLDPNIVIAMAQTESAMKPNAVSRVGARGLMQLMPGTFDGWWTSVGKDITATNDKGEKVKKWASKPSITDPEANIYAGANYMATGFHLVTKASDTSPKFLTSPYRKHTLDLMSAGYNAGYGKAEVALAGWPESKNHAVKVANNYALILNCLNRKSTPSGSATELKQYDSQWQTYPNLAGLGCGATSTAMALNTLGYSTDPVAVHRLQDKEGAAAAGRGITNIRAMSRITSDFPGLSMQYTEDWSVAQQALQAGKPVVFGYVAGSSIFPTVSSTGHWVMLYGYDSSTGQYTVHNPGRAEGAYQKQVTSDEVLTTPNSRSFWIMSR